MTTVSFWGSNIMALSMGTRLELPKKTIFTFRMIRSDENTDNELLRLISSGNDDAFREIHSRYFSVLFTYAYNVLRDRDVCMDIIQDVMVWFWEHRKGHEIRNLKGYLLMAVKYQASNYIRNQKLRNYFPIEELKNIPSYSEQSIELKELKNIIQSFTDQLPERCKEIFKMSREEMFTNKEIAQKLGISEKTVSVQILRALNKLRSELGKAHFWSYFFL